MQIHARPSHQGIHYSSQLKLQEESSFVSDDATKREENSSPFTYRCWMTKCLPFCLYDGPESRWAARGRGTWHSRRGGALLQCCKTKRRGEEWNFPVASAAFYANTIKRWLLLRLSYCFIVGLGALLRFPLSQNQNRRSGCPVSQFTLKFVSI